MKPNTVNDLLLPMMGKPSVIRDTCAVCGKPANNQHHIVRRGAGTAYDPMGRELKKPTVTLCGSGTTGCHGMAHQQRLHFRWVEADPKRGEGKVFGCGHWEFKRTKSATKYQDALAMDGWRRL